MSLGGRYVIDRLKRSIGRYVKLPVPPYDNPNYWEDVYKRLTPSDVFEWGGFDCEDLMEYSCRSKQYDMKQLVFAASQDELGSMALADRSLEQTTTSWGEALGVAPNDTTQEEEPILMLGCGNSMLGEDMIEQGWKGPIVQVDVSARAIHDLSQRCASKEYNNNMRFVQDDATHLSAIESERMTVAIDKGMIDAIFCAEEIETCQEILKSVHRVLRPNGVFCCFSFSRPEFILRKLLLPLDPMTHGSARSHEQKLIKAWSSIEIQRLGFIYLYRFMKNTPPTMNVRLKSKPKPMRRR